MDVSAIRSMRSESSRRQSHIELCESNVQEAPAVAAAAVAHPCKELRADSGCTQWRSYGSEASVAHQPSELERRGLSSEVGEGLLRGVRLDRALFMCGRHWSGEVSGGVGSASASADLEYSLSEPTCFLDDFISHDWATGRWYKFMSLCVEHNGAAAVIVSLVVSIVSGAAQAFLFPVSLLPFPYEVSVAGLVIQTRTGCFSLCCGAFAFAIVLLFWQRLRRLLRLAPHIVFVDKLCIHQTDQVLKARGIAGLAGFLRYSRRLHVLWSPRYFTRLWCVYELASWIHLNETDLRPTLFTPVAQAVGQVIGATTIWLYWFLFMFVLGPGSNIGFMFPTFVVFVLALLALPLHALRRLARDVRGVPVQLATFSIREARCYCCQHAHVHPVTGAALTCDRKEVYAALLDWFGNQDIEKRAGESHSKMYLDRFDECVRGRFRDQVLQTLWVKELRWQQILFMTVPSLWFAADRFTTCRDIYLNAPADTRLLLAGRYAASILTVTGVMYMSVLQLIWRMAILVDRMFGVPGRGCLDVLVTGLYATCALMVMMLLWTPIYVGQTLESEIAQVLSLAVELVIFGLLFCGHAGRAVVRMLRRQSGDKGLPNDSLKACRRPESEASRVPVTISQV